LFFPCWRTPRIEMIVWISPIGFSGLAKPRVQTGCPVKHAHHAPRNFTPQAIGTC
jgi:hypothetical protein